MDSFFLLVQFIALFALLGYVIWYVFKTIFDTWNRRGHDHWPLISANILRVRTDVSYFDGNQIETHRVEYYYDTPSGRFQGEFPALEPWSSHYTTLTPWDEMYPTGKEIKVHCDPTNPSVSVPVVPDPEGMPKAI